MALVKEALYVYLYDNLNRTLNDLYCTLEYDSNTAHAHRSVDNLTGWVQDFADLASRLELINPGVVERQPRVGIAWAVRKAPRYQAGVEAAAARAIVEGLLSRLAIAEEGSASGEAATPIAAPPDSSPASAASGTPHSSPRVEVPVADAVGSRTPTAHHKPPPVTGERTLQLLVDEFSKTQLAWGDLMVPAAVEPTARDPVVAVSAPHAVAAASVEPDVGRGLLRHDATPAAAVASKPPRLSSDVETLNRPHATSSGASSTLAHAGHHAGWIRREDGTGAHAAVSVAVAHVPAEAEVPVAAMPPKAGTLIPLLATALSLPAPLLSRHKTADTGLLNLSPAATDSGTESESGPWLVVARRGQQLPQPQQHRPGLVLPAPLPPSVGTVPPPSAVALRDKLSSPNRQRPPPQAIGRRGEEKQAAADRQRELLAEERRAKLGTMAMHRRDVAEHLSAQTESKKVALTERLTAGAARRDEQVRARAVKAGSEVQKVLGLSTQRKHAVESLRAETEQKQHEAELRKERTIAEVRERAGGHARHVLESAQQRRANEEAHSAELREAFDRRLEEVELRRGQLLRARAHGATLLALPAASRRESGVSYAAVTTTGTFQGGGAATAGVGNSARKLRLSDASVSSVSAADASDTPLQRASEAAPPSSVTAPSTVLHGQANHAGQSKPEPPRLRVPVHPSHKLPPVLEALERLEPAVLAAVSSGVEPHANTSSAANAKVPSASVALATTGAMPEAVKAVPALTPTPVPPALSTDAAATTTGSPHRTAAPSTDDERVPSLFVIETPPRSVSRGQTPRSAQPAVASHAPGVSGEVHPVSPARVQRVPLHIPRSPSAPGALSGLRSSKNDTPPHSAPAPPTAAVGPPRAAAFPAPLGSPARVYDAAHAVSTSAAGMPEQRVKEQTHRSSESAKTRRKRLQKLRGIIADAAATCRVSGDTLPPPVSTAPSGRAGSAALGFVSAARVAFATPGLASSHASLRSAAQALVRTLVTSAGGGGAGKPVKTFARHNAAVRSSAASDPLLSALFFVDTPSSSPAVATSTLDQALLSFQDSSSLASTGASSAAAELLRGVSASGHHGDGSTDVLLSLDCWTEWHVSRVAVHSTAHADGRRALLLSGWAVPAIVNSAVTQAHDAAVRLRSSQGTPDACSCATAGGCEACALVSAIPGDAGDADDELVATSAQPPPSKPWRPVCGSLMCLSAALTMLLRHADLAGAAAPERTLVQLTAQYACSAGLPEQLAELTSAAKLCSPKIQLRLAPLLVQCFGLLAALVRLVPSAVFPEASTLQGSNSSSGAAIVPASAPSGAPAPGRGAPADPLSLPSSSVLLQLFDDSDFCDIPILLLQLLEFASASGGGSVAGLVSSRKGASTATVATTVGVADGKHHQHDGTLSAVLRVCGQALAVLTHTGRVNPGLLQRVLGPGRLWDPTQHLLSRLLTLASRPPAPETGTAAATSGHSSSTGDREVTDILLRHVLLLVGQLACGSAAHQEALHWGGEACLLLRLCTLPLRYFSQASFRDELFPALVLAGFGSIANRDIISQHVSCSALAAWVAAGGDGVAVIPLAVRGAAVEFFGGGGT
jgi:hypothetical protein